MYLSAGINNNFQEVRMFDEFKIKFCAKPKYESGQKKLKPYTYFDTTLT